MKFIADLPPEDRQDDPLEQRNTCQTPISGDISFENVKMSYPGNTSLALNGIDFRVRPGTKVGICGRTGSGKSSVLSVLFRLVDIRDGLIQGECISL